MAEGVAGIAEFCGVSGGAYPLKVAAGGIAIVTCSTDQQGVRLGFDCAEKPIYTKGVVVLVKNGQFQPSQYEGASKVEHT